MKNLSKMTAAEIEIEFSVELRKLLKKWRASLYAVEGKHDYGMCARVGVVEVPLGWEFTEKGSKP